MSSSFDFHYDSDRLREARLRVAEVKLTLAEAEHAVAVCRDTLAVSELAKLEKEGEA